MTGQHRPPPRLTVGRVAIADAGLLAVSLTVAIAAPLAPHATAPHTAAAPTAVELPREPTGHGGPISYPTFPTNVWAPSDGPVVANGQRLPAVTVVAAPVKTTAAPTYKSPARIYRPAPTTATTTAPTQTTQTAPSGLPTTTATASATPTPTDIPPIVTTDPLPTVTTPAPTTTTHGRRPK